MRSNTKVSHQSVEGVSEFSTSYSPSNLCTMGYLYTSDKQIVYPFDWFERPGLQAFLEETINTKGDGDYVGFRGVGVKIRRVNRGGELIWWFQRALSEGEHEYERVDPDTFIPAEWYWMNPKGLHEVIQMAKEYGENGDIIHFGGLTVKLKTDKHASPFILYRDLKFIPQADKDSETGVL